MRIRQSRRVKADGCPGTEAGIAHCRQDCAGRAAIAPDPHLLAGVFQPGARLHHVKNIPAPIILHHDISVSLNDIGAGWNRQGQKQQKQESEVAFHGSNLRHRRCVEKPQLRDRPGMVLIILLHLSGEGGPDAISGPPIGSKHVSISHHQLYRSFEYGR